MKISYHAVPVAPSAVTPQSGSPNRKLKNPSQRGGNTRLAAFMLVEVVVSFAIMGILFIGLFSGLAWGFTMAQWSRENARATQVMVDKMEQFRLFTWSDLTSGNVQSSFSEPLYETPDGVSQGINYTGVVTVARAPITEGYAAKMRLVTVQLNWLSGGLSHTREISTLVAENGLQKYLW